MAIDIDYAEARSDLARLFDRAEIAFASKALPLAPSSAITATERMFASDTQSYREAALGCALARLQSGSVNIRIPYANQHQDAFNGRTLDETVVNPFLQSKEVPASKGPYLAVFRRSVGFIPETRSGVRDKAGYDAMLAYLAALEEASSEEEVERLILLLLFRFMELRNSSQVTLAKIERLSLAQYSTLIENLLQTRSGGLLPVLLTVAMFRALKVCHTLPWEIEWQGINEADKASGAGGDITIRVDGAVFLAVEVTERPVDGARVVSTFNTKVVKNAIPDYLFLTTQAPGADAKDAAGRYFAQGHEMNFLDLRDWIVNILGTIGAGCRKQFTEEFLALLAADAPAALKVRWNDLIKGLFQGEAQKPLQSN